MSNHDTCPRCGGEIHLKAYEDHRRFYLCGSWIRKDTGEFVGGGITCEDRTTIKDAAAVIRAFLDGDRDAREKGKNWIAENTP
jgi:hypothetical protein